MTPNEIINKITSQPRWYEEYGIPQSTASGLVTRFRSGTIKKKTLDKYLSIFGYEKKQPELWKLKKKQIIMDKIREAMDEIYTGIEKYIDEFGTKPDFIVMSDSFYYSILDYYELPRDHEPYTAMFGVPIEISDKMRNQLFVIV